MPLKVRMVLHKFSRGGSDRVAAYLARGFVAAGHDVALIVLARGGEVEEYLVELLGSDIPIRTLGEAGSSREGDLIRTLPALARELKREAPDVVLSTANNTSLVSALAVRLAGLRGRTRLAMKTTNPIASSRHRGLARRLRLASYRWIFGWIDAVWTLSEEESAEMRAEFPKFAPILRAVANPYVTPAMLAAPAVVPRSPGKTVITIARLTAQKRVERLIAAFARVTTPDARLLILGEGEDRAALEALVAELGLGERVAMPGYVPDVAAALHAADLFVLPSDYEGLPAAVLEAMAANCPVLSTDCFPSARSLVGTADGCAIIDDVAPAALGAQIDRHLDWPRPVQLAAVAERYSIANGVVSHVAALADLGSAAQPMIEPAKRA